MDRCSLSRIIYRNKTIHHKRNGSCLFKSVFLQQQKNYRSHWLFVYSGAGNYYTIVQTIIKTIHMKKLLALGAAAAVLVACNSSSNSTKNLEALYKKSYDLKDIPTAITAVQLLLQTDSTNALRDSLPGMYFAVQNIDACLTTTNESLKRNPDNEELNNLKLLCLEQKGEGDQALKLSEELYKKTGKLEYIYKKASMELMT